MMPETGVILRTGVVALIEVDVTTTSLVRRAIEIAEVVTTTPKTEAITRPEL